MSAISTPVTPSNRRRMAPFIALGVVAVLAAAFLLLHKKGSSDSTGSSAAPTPATTTPAPTAGSTPSTPVPAAPPAHAAAKTTHHAAASAHLSDPFGRGVTKAATGSSSSAPGSSTTTSSPSTPTVTTHSTVPTSSTGTSSTPTTTSTPTTSTGSASTPTVVTPVTSTVNPSTTTSVTPVTAPVLPWRVYHADVRVTPAKSAVHRRLVRLTPLADAQVPFALYLGAVRGGKRVAFLLNRHATVTGPGRCAPFHRSYRTLYLKPNQAAHVAIPFFGTTVTYRLGVMHLTSHRVSSAHAARVANHRVSKPGKTMLRRFGLLSSLRFSTERGVVPAPKHLKSCA
jgi:hypothetical protein